MTPWTQTFLLLGIAIALHSTRLSWPLRWAETFYHEISHGVICILTGGRVVRLDLLWHGGGSCTTQGGIRLFVLLAGYVGASLWGAALFFIGFYLNETGMRWWLMAELVVIALAFLLWAKNLVTMLILLLIAAVYGAALYFPPEWGLHYALQVLGLFVMLNALAAPFHLIDGQHVGDGAALQDLTRIVPEGFWIIGWVIFASLTLGYCLATGVGLR